MKRRTSCPFSRATAHKVITSWLKLILRANNALENDQGPIFDALKELQTAVSDLQGHCTRIVSKLNIDLLPADKIEFAMISAKWGTSQRNGDADIYERNYYLSAAESFAGF